MLASRKNGLPELIRSESEGVRELIRSQREESRRYQDKQEKRDEEWKRYQEKRDEEFGAHQAELHRLRVAAEAREEETREFNRELLLRNEKVYKAVIAQVEENTKQIRANTQAVLNVLDRFNGSGGLAA